MAVVNIASISGILFVPTIPGAFGIVYKGLLMDWNNVAMRGVALKTLKGNKYNICVFLTKYCR